MKLFFLLVIIATFLLVVSCNNKIDKNSIFIINETIGDYKVDSAYGFNESVIRIRDIPAYTYQVNYMREDLYDKFDYDNIVVVTVTKYGTNKDIQEKLINSIRLKLYNVSFEKIKNNLLYKLTNKDGIWYVWLHKNYCVMYGFNNKNQDPSIILNSYLQLYPSTMKEIDYIK